MARVPVLVKLHGEGSLGHVVDVGGGEVRGVKKGRELGRERGVGARRGGGDLGELGEALQRREEECLEEGREGEQG